MFKIGEFSKLSQVSIRMLRYYDETGLLKPEKVDGFTGYRLYSSRQIKRLNKILFLRDLGFNVSEIASALSNWEDENINRLLRDKKEEIELNIKAEQIRLAKIERAENDIRHKNIEINCNVTIKPVPSSRVLSLRRRMPDYFAEGRLWKELETYAAQNSIPLSEKTFSIYHDLEYREKDVDIEICAEVKTLGKDDGDFRFRQTNAVPNMACTMVNGPFENIAGAYRAFASWLGGQSIYRMTGQSRQIVHRGPWNEESAENFLTEIQVPLDLI